MIKNDFFTKGLILISFIDQNICFKSSWNDQSNLALLSLILSIDWIQKSYLIWELINFTELKLMFKYFESNNDWFLLLFRVEKTLSNNQTISKTNNWMNRSSRKYTKNKKHFYPRNFGD